MLAALPLLIFPLLVAFAASSDLLTMRISNWIAVGLVGAFLVLALATGMPLQQIGMNVLCAVLVLVFTFAFFAFGWIGGGDAKLASAISLWLGFGVLFPFLIYASLLGGSLTLMLLTARHYPLPPQLHYAWIERLHDRKSGVPYGIALAAAGLLVYPQTSIFQNFIG